ncbi:MAG: helix-turn-helix domain-containing protein [Actinomycetota bacterium]|nr:helix-turn-helix domain-containing protein [Actinomycetota bacterium]
MRLQDLPPTLSIPQAAEILGVGRDLAYQAAHRGELPTVRVGRRLLVRTEELLELLGALPGGCTARQGEDSIAGHLPWQDGPNTGAEAAHMVADSVMGAR